MVKVTSHAGIDRRDFVAALLKAVPDALVSRWRSPRNPSSLSRATENN